MKRHLLSILIALAVMVVGTSAFAQEDDIVTLNEEGITAFTEGRFEEAATKFRKAYELKPEQTLKKNEALAWFKANKCTEALRATSEYMALQPTDELSVNEAKAVIVKCNIQKAQESLAAKNHEEAEAFLVKAEASGPGDEDKQAIASARAEIQVERDRVAQEKALAAKRAEEQRQREAAMERTSSKKTLGLVLASAGGAIIVGTLVYHLSMALGTAPKFKDNAAAGDDLAEYDKLGKRLETANWLIPTLYAVGLGTAGVGGFFWMSSQGMESDPSTALGPGKQDRETTVGVTVTWRF